MNLSHAGEPGWLEGSVDGRTGWIPEAYLRRADGTADAGQDQMQAEQGAVTQAQAGRVLYDLAASDELTLELKKGETVDITANQAMDADWWYGKTQGEEEKQG